MSLLSVEEPSQRSELVLSLPEPDRSSAPAFESSYHYDATNHCPGCAFNENVSARPIRALKSGKCRLHDFFEWARVETWCPSFHLLSALP